MPDRERKRVPDHRSDVLKVSLPQGHPAHPRNKENPMLSEDSEKESRDEATRRGMEALYQRQCGSRSELFCTESGRKEDFILFYFLILFYSAILHSQTDLLRQPVIRHE